MNDDDVQPRLKCDVELDFAGPDEKALSKRAADILRQLAARIENEEFESGHHPVADDTGKPVGTLYVDYYGELT